MNRTDRALLTNLDILLSNLPGIRDGRFDAIHDARVATRRLRAVLAVGHAADGDERWLSAAEVVRGIGRALGRARDADVMLEELDGAELHVPTAARAVAQSRIALVAAQEKAHRRLVKELDRTELDVLVALGRARGRVWFSFAADRHARALRGLIPEAAGRLHESVAAAGGVYFPNRLHTVRVRAKRLRYLLELLADGQVTKKIPKLLRRVQKAIGELHDRQTLLAEVESHDAARTLRDEYVALDAWLRAEMPQLHQNYLRDRKALTRVCARLAAVGGRALSGWWAIGALAAPSAAVVLARSRRPAPQPAIATPRALVVRAGR